MRNFEDEKNEKLALNDFLRGFKPSKNEEPAKKEQKKSSKNLSHSVSSGKCSWVACDKDT